MTTPTYSEYSGPERRKFVRLDYMTPIACKVCRPEIISKILQGYTVDISEAGLLCHISQKVSIGDTIWLSFDRATLSICQELEQNCFIYQGGIIGKVARVEPRPDASFNVGIQFMTRQEQNVTNIYPKLHFLEINPQAVEVEDEDEDEQPETETENENGNDDKAGEEES